MQPASGAFLSIATVLVLALALYRRTTADSAFVRTGSSGERVVMSGGALVIPVLHELVRVNLNTLRISVVLRDAHAVVTQDRLRANVELDFYVRVIPEALDVSVAARTLGDRTTSVDAMREFLQSRFEDALRTAAGEQSLEALRENRAAFSARVRELAAAGLKSNGLEIDSVSLLEFDHAAREFYNAHDPLDAELLTRLTAEIEDRRVKRNELEREGQLAVERQNLAAEQQLLELKKLEEYARMDQEREIAIRRGQVESHVATETAQSRRAIQVAEVAANEALELARIASEHTLREERVRSEQQSRSLEIEHAKGIQVAQQVTEIEIANHAQLRNAACAEAELSHVKAVEAEEAVTTAREVERAEREKRLALMHASRDVEVKGLEAVHLAESESRAAEYRAAAIRKLAEAEAEAGALRREGEIRLQEMEARARLALNEADNVLSPDAMRLRAKLAAIQNVEAVIRASVKPLERLAEIKIVHVDGLGAASADGGGPSLSDQVMSSALKYRVQAPLVDALLKSAGLQPDVLVNSLNAHEVAAESRG